MHASDHITADAAESPLHLPPHHTYEVRFEIAAFWIANLPMPLLSAFILV